ncbi:transporter substrate-binding domain-containing protein [Vibrio sp. SCSIO 43136]|uniref:substrate-binding periplasmic protein n=1 Tax=Vibrio sp. SCSIO 43136 TaxID=2819101 RepID=UPI0020757AD2|nr:transporter substrate-binding domain-containing protein [Vibrio sp. SCSIO 43136]USD68173.1 transporter substrate-binding domain-containing protein [Vibrio sp. SCSIO 43136]
MIRTVVSWFICFSLPVCATDKITIASGDYPPFSGPSLPFEGYVSHLVTEAYSSQDIKVELHYLPWVRTLRDSAKGKYAATMFWACSPTRRAKFHCSETPVLEEEVVIYHLTETPIKRSNTFDDLKHYKFGYVRGYEYGPEFQKALRDGEISVEYVNNDVQNFRKLLAKRIDILLLGKKVGQTVLTQHFNPDEQTQITHIPKPLFYAKYHLLFPKSRTDSLKWMEKFDAGMAELMKSESYQDLQQRLLNEGYHAKPQPSTLAP